MKLLLDENLSRRLLPRLIDLFPESSHLAWEGLLEAADTVVWQYAKTCGYCILTADADFYELATSVDSPAKVIWLRGCGYPAAAAEEVIRHQSIRIMEFLEDAEQSVLILSQR